ncbi:MAG: hypothetical protein ACLFQX_05505 [Candidatus Kapaibacterium sp.]
MSDARKYARLALFWLSRVVSLAVLAIVLAAACSQTPDPETMTTGDWVLLGSFSIMLAGLIAGWFREIAGLWLTWVGFGLYVLFYWIFTGSPVDGLIFWFIPLTGAMFYLHKRLGE